MRKIYLLFMVAFALFSSMHTAVAAGKLRIGTEGFYPPFTEIRPDGTVIGFDLDIAFALCAKMHEECIVVTQEWDGLIPALKDKRFDLIIASMSITDERLEEVDFSDPYYTNKINFVGKKGVLLEIGAESLKGKTIGVQEKTVAEEWLREHYPDVTVKAYENQQKAYTDLAAGNLDGILADMFVNWTWLETPEGKGFEFKGEPVFDDDKIAIAVRKEDEHLKERLNRALQEILADGTYKEINAKYFPFSIY